jgi:phage baseplate assembly protein gpV
MIEFGTVKEVDATKATVVVEFPQLQTEATCTVLVPTTGANAVYYLPSTDTQVVCWIETGKNLCLGAVFSEADPVPDGVDPDTQVQQFGKTKVTSKADSWKVEQDQVSVELVENKASLKNSTTDLKTILNDLIIALKGLMVSTGVGPSGTPLPNTIAALEQVNTKINALLK